MFDQKTMFLLTDRVADTADDSDTSSWSDVCSLKSKSSEKSEDDNETLFFPIMHYFLRLKRKRVDDYVHIIDSWNDVEFKDRLGVYKSTASKLICKSAFNNIISVITNSIFKVTYVGLPISLIYTTIIIYL